MFGAGAAAVQAKLVLSTVLATESIGGGDGWVRGMWHERAAGRLGNGGGGVVGGDDAALSFFFLIGAVGRGDGGDLGCGGVVTFIRIVSGSGWLREVSPRIFDEVSESFEREVFDVFAGGGAKLDAGMILEVAGENLDKAGDDDWF